MLDLPLSRATVWRDLERGAFDLDADRLGFDFGPILGDLCVCNNNIAGLAEAEKGGDSTQEGRDPGRWRQNLAAEGRLVDCFLDSPRWWRGWKTMCFGSDLLRV